MNTTYTSKLSYGLLAFITACLILPVFLIKPKPEDASLIFKLSAIGLTYVLILYIVLNTKYRIQDNILKVNIGFIKYKSIEIEKIKEVAKTNNIIASPAPSFDRIKIKYGKYGSIILSPKNKEEFVKHLQSINPNIQSKL